MVIIGVCMDHQTWNINFTRSYYFIMTIKINLKDLPIQAHTVLVEWKVTTRQCQQITETKACKDTLFPFISINHEQQAYSKFPYDTAKSWKSREQKELPSNSWIWLLTNQTYVDTDLCLMHVCGRSKLNGDRATQRHV